MPPLPHTALIYFSHKQDFYTIQPADQGEYSQGEMMMVLVRQASSADLGNILTIYNQGIEDRIATLETDIKDAAYMLEWFNKHQGRYTVLVAEQDHHVVGWASINSYSPRSTYDGVGDLSIYIHREHRGKGIGKQLLQYLETMGK